MRALFGRCGMGSCGGYYYVKVIPIVALGNSMFT